MQAFDSFSNSTELVVNPTKCKAYFGNMENNVKEKICNIIYFTEGPLSFSYLGIPLTSKKLSNHHFLVLVEKIVVRVKHWSIRLLSSGLAHKIKKVYCFP